MNETDKIRISVNGESVELPAGATMVDLLAQLQINSRAIAVEINHEIHPASSFDQCVLQPNDQLEIVTLVGGG